MVAREAILLATDGITENRKGNVDHFGRTNATMVEILKNPKVCLGEY